MLIGFIYKWHPIARMVALVIAVAGQWASMTPFVAWTADYVCTRHTSLTLFLYFLFLLNNIISGPR